MDRAPARRKKVVEVTYEAVSVRRPQHEESDDVSRPTEVDVEVEDSRLHAQFIGGLPATLKQGKPKIR